MEKRYAIFKSPYGFCAGVLSGKNLIRFYLPGKQRKILASLKKEFPLARRDDRALWLIRKSLAKYFHTGSLGESPRTLLGGFSPFVRSVLRIVKKIPPGRVLSYGEVAKRMGRTKGAARSIGRALSRNPVPLFIPCHRVIRSDGKLGGFSADGGERLKYRLLRLERLQLEKRKEISVRSVR